MNVLSELRSRFVQALTPLTDDPAAFAGLVRPVQDPRFGDFQANCAMPLAKQRGASPRSVAEQIVAYLHVDDLCEPPTIAGPGFINLKLRDGWIETAANALVGDDRLGVGVVARPKPIVIDYSAPNVAKPMHVGHLRSTVIGAALCRLFEFAGHSVKSDNHIGDWGTQFGMIIFGYKHFIDPEAYARDAVGELARLYRLVNQLGDYHDARDAIELLDEKLAEQRRNLAATEARVAEAGSEDRAQLERNAKKLRGEIEESRQELASLRAKRQRVDDDPELRALADKHPQIAVESREETARLHAGDPENRRLWGEFVPQCLAALETVYDRLEIDFDMALGESYYQPMLADVVQSLSERGIASQSDGAVCVFVEENAAPFIIRKRDGAFTYATTDLATIRYRSEVLGAETIIYVVDSRQSEHFKLLFDSARRWGYDRIDYRHVSFGTIMGPDKRPFKTRSGDTVGLESLIDEAIVRARRIVDENDDAKESPELDETTRAAVAEAVGIGGIKYADLRHNRDSDYVFLWDKMLATTGDTATYIQYSFARICGIFRRGGIDRRSLRLSGAKLRITSPAERRLALTILRFPESIDSALADCRPNSVTQFLFETADSFSKFYEECPVLKEPDEALRNSRLLLCDLTARVLEKGLWLLGIRVCEQM